MVKLVCTRTPCPLLLWSFFAELLSSWWVWRGTGEWVLILPKVQHIVVPLVKLHKVPFCLFPQSIAVPLSGSTAISSASHSSHCHIIHKLAVGALCPIIQVNCKAPVSTPMVHHWWQGSSWSSCQWWQSSGPSHSAGFQFISLLPCLDSTSSACLQGCYGDSVNCSFLIHPAVISLY